LPAPARPSETNADGERRCGKGEEAIGEMMKAMEMMEVMEASEGQPIEAWRKSWPERKAVGSDKSTAEATTAHHPSTKASTHHRTVKTSTETPAEAAHPSIRRH
jgi:hypothetical protein